MPPTPVHPQQIAAQRLLIILLPTNCELTSTLGLARYTAQFPFSYNVTAGSKNRRLLQTEA